MVDESNPGMGLLAVTESKTAIIVVRVENPEDWLARFEKSPNFPARAWAENMVRIYNRRLSYTDSESPTPPGIRPATYHPGADE